MWHGLMDSADTWVTNRKEVSPAFVLVEQGYDVWLANSRGNKYSRGHEDPRISDKEYWSFSF
jgi:lysosomal acid lipase/cholesteryl ester hydrolase